MGAQAKSTARKRPLFDVLKQDIVDIVYFFAPLILVHNLAWALKPSLMNAEDARGPWEYLWHQTLRLTGTDRRFLFVYGTAAVVFVTYWSGAFAYLVLDVTQGPQALNKYKINPGKNAPPDWSKLFKLFWTVCFNIALIIPSQIFISWPSYEVGADPDVWKVPTVYECFFHMLLAILGHDVFFYHAHTFLHNKSLYKHIHKKHHEWIAPVAASAIYAHPIEHFLTGIISPAWTFYFTMPAISTQWLWFSWIIIQTQNDHSGYHFPLVFSPEFHDFHHLRFHTSYGWLGFWDWFWGTDAEFEEAEVHKRRNVRLHTTKSARELVPDIRKIK